MSDDVDPFVHDDAAYVMGALSESERLAFEAHLADCPRCTESVAELSGVTDLLDKVELDRVLGQAEDLEPLPDLLLPRLIQSARAERRRRSIRLVTSGAVAASLVAVAVTLGASGGSRPAAGTSVAMTAVRPAAVTATLRTTPTSWGTRVSLDCRWIGATSGTAKRTYRLVAVPQNGDATQVIAQWAVLPGDDAKVTGSTDLATADIAAFEVRALPSDTVVLQARPA